MDMSNKIEELKLSSMEKRNRVAGILSGLILNEVLVERIKNVFKNEMELALKMQPSSLQMENTYIPELIDGTENGTFLAMDLGGTNLRVISLCMRAGQVEEEVIKHYDLPDNLRTGCGTVLFDYLATCVDAFAKELLLRDDIQYPLGFTFSFPMRQNSLDSGVLITWTKSFNCPDVVGEDAVKMLRNSLEKCQRHNIEVLAILNDTTGTLMHGAFLDSRTRIGIVLGTGTNGCYMERANLVEHWEKVRHGEHHVLIDIEWGAFGDNGVIDFIKTDFDRAVDKGSLLQTSFTFEKYIGGRYLGELCRQILQKLYNEGLFLPTLPKEKFPLSWLFGSNNISIIENDAITNTSANIKMVIEKHFQTLQYTDDDLEILRYVCGIISLRAAQLLAINTSTVLNRLDGETDIVIAIDGSVYKHHPRLRHWLDEYTNLWAPTKKCSYMLAEDGSGKGAALVAAIADKLRKRPQYMNC